MKDKFSERSNVASRTPITEAASVLASLADIWETWGDLNEKMEFFEHIAGEMWADAKTSGEAQLEDLKKTEDLTDWNGEPFVPGFKAAIIQISIVQVSCAFAVQAMKTEKLKKDTAAAWVYVCEAFHWLGILQGVMSGRSMEKDSSVRFALSELGKKGADAAHIENRAFKKTVFDWCDSNMSNFRSIDSAAAAVAGNIVPVVFRTARSWISEWKKRQSAGTL